VKRDWPAARVGYGIGQEQNLDLGLSEAPPWTFLKSSNKEFASTGELAMAPARLGKKPIACMNSSSKGFDFSGAVSILWI
jgi:hypothetical protein